MEVDLVNRATVITFFEEYDEEEENR